MTSASFAVAAVDDVVADFDVDESAAAHPWVMPCEGGLQQGLHR